jgi:hypothetical protein
LAAFLTAFLGAASFGETIGVRALAAATRLLAR